MKVGVSEMSRSLGPMRQVAYLVEDIDTAMSAWAESAGVGPWFVQREASPKIHYEGGGPDPGLTISIALANVGELQVELLQQHCQAPSIFRDHLCRYGYGAHHWAVWSQEYDATYARAVQNGLRAAQEGESRGGRFAYFRLSRDVGGIVEIVDLTPARQELNERIRRASIGWDGSDPVRPFNRSASFPAMPLIREQRRI